jgi:crotonobetainyl-CoA:carnitine CoA-transferase CaiB-like acyl-CoA transferase
MHRNATGEGQEVKTSLLGTALAVFGSHLIEQSVTRIDRVGSGNRVQTSAPSDVFATVDGHVLTHVVGNGLFRRWAKLMGEEARWADDPLFATDQSRADHGAPILARMRAWCALRTTAQAVEQLEAAGLPAGPVLTPQQALDDPQVDAMQFLKSIAGYPGLTRPAMVPDLPISFGRISGGIDTNPPTAGQHSREILAGLGFTQSEIENLIAAGVAA